MNDEPQGDEAQELGDVASETETAVATDVACEPEAATEQATLTEKYEAPIRETTVPPLAGSVDQLQASVIDADIIKAKRIVVEGGGGRAVLAASDHGVRLDMTSHNNFGNVVVSLCKGEGALVALYHDNAETGHNLSLQVPDTADQTPKLWVTDGRDRTKAIGIDLMELAETLRATMRDCEEACPAHVKLTSAEGSAAEA